MSDNKLYCSLCGKEFAIDCSVTEIAEHISKEHNVGGIIGLVGAALMKNPDVEVQSHLTQQTEDKK